MIGTKHAGPTTPTDTVIYRVECPCGSVNYGVIRGSSAYKMRESTLALQASVLDVFEEIGPPMTVRQVYYRLTAIGAVDKTESGYRRVQKQLTNMRRAGSVPYHWIADNSRSWFQAQQYRGLGDALGRMQEYYRRDLWADQAAHVEIWLEKRALVSQLMPTCNEFGVKLFPCGGYASISFVYDAAVELREIEKPIYVYHLSDFDADGAYSSEALESELRLHGADIHFYRMALRPEQIDAFDLYSALREQKKSSARYKWWLERFGDSPACELDAIDPRQLRQLVHNAITRHIDPYEWQRLQEVEQVERQTLERVVQMLPGLKR